MTSTPDPALHPAAPDTGRKKRLMIADDNPDILETARTLFELLGFEVVEAHDGHAALGTFQHSQPDVAILDIGMPGLSGYEVARAIRGSPAGRGALLIAVTGWGQASDVQRSTDAGFDYHFTKPADLTEIGAVITQRLR